MAMPPPKHRNWLGLWMAMSCAFTGMAAAQSYPGAPIRLVVPFPPAGGTDTLSRMVAQALSEQRGWSLVIDNKPGAGGNLGLDIVAKSRPDGLTLGMAQTANLAINPALYKKMPYDALKDFTPVALVASQPTVLVVSGHSPYRKLADLVTGAKAHPGALSMASPGSGTVGHLAGELFAKQAGITWLHVPYKGAAPALNDVMAGQVQLNFATPSGAMGLIRAGKLRALAVTSAERLYALPDVPTVAESGYKGFVAEDWKALVAPAGTPATVVQALNDAVNAALNKNEVRAKLSLDGGKPLGGSSQDLAKFMQQEHARWAQAVRTSGATAD
jgi:tripartite-type tricarboxylate transporter receptor subunit TctC